MKAKRITTVSLILLLAISSKRAAGALTSRARVPAPAVASSSISEIHMSPARPAWLSHGEEVKVTFKYSSDRRDGVRIFVRPMTGAQLSANYAASGSPLYGVGSGTGAADFTIRDGDVTVDGIRFEMRSDDQRQLLHSQVIPVRYRFVDDPFRAEGSRRSEVLITSEGFMEIPNPDGSALLFKLGGAQGIRTPQGQILFSHVQTSVTDVGPPVRVETADETWVVNLNQWLEAMGVGMLDTIERLAGNATSFGNYKEYEDSRCQTLYERVDTRQKFLQMLILRTP